MAATVAFIGLGAMGAPIASNLIDAGFALRVFNRNRERTRALGERGATVCTTIAEAVKGAQFVVSIVSDDQATRQVMLGKGGVVASAEPGTLIIDSSTNTPAMIREVVESARQRGLDHLDAPVSGSVPQASAGELDPGADAMKSASSSINGAGLTADPDRPRHVATITSALAEQLRRWPR